MKKIKSVILLGIILLLVASCKTTQLDDTMGGEDNNMSEAKIHETKIQMMIDDLLSGELTDEEFIELINELSEEESNQLFDELRNQLGAEGFTSLLGRLLGETPPLTEEQLEERRVRDEERRRVNVWHIVYGEYIPAADDIDLQTIERIVFIDSIDIEGYSFVLDRMYGKVYYNPETSFFDMLEFIPYSAEFKEEDLTRFIHVIEESDLRNWPESHTGEIDEYVEGGHRAWIIGILFSDGTMLRRSGSGMFWTDVASSPDQLAILTDFIKTIGAEIELRHKAEVDSEN